MPSCFSSVFWDVIYDFRVQTMFCSSSLPFVLFVVRVLFVGRVLFVVRVLCMLFYLFTYTGVQQNFHRYPCYLTVTRVTQVVRFVEQKLLILMEQSSSPSF